MYRNGALDLWEEGEGEAAGAARGEEQVDPEEYDDYDDDEEDEDEDIVKRKPILVEPTSPPPLRYGRNSFSFLAHFFPHNDFF